MHINISFRNSRDIILLAQIRLTTWYWKWVSFLLVDLWNPFIAPVDGFWTPTCWWRFFSYLLLSITGLTVRVKQCLRWLMSSFESLTFLTDFKQARFRSGIRRFASSHSLSASNLCWTWISLMFKCTIDLMIEQLHRSMLFHDIHSCHTREKSCLNVICVIIKASL